MTILFAGGCLRRSVLRVHGLQQLRSDVDQNGAAFGVRLGGDEVGKGPGGQLSRDFRHDVNLHENGALFAVRADTTAEGICECRLGGDA